MNAPRASSFRGAFVSLFDRHQDRDGLLSQVFLWSTWTGIAMVGCALADFVLGFRSLGVRSVFSVIGLGLFGGVLSGVLLGVFTHVVSHVPRRWHFAPWSVVACSVALLLAGSLEVWANLGGRYNTLAIAALCGSIVFALVLALVGLGLQTAADRSAYLPSLSGPVRIGVAVALLLSAGACVWLDRTQFPDLYPGAHRALRWGALALTSSAGLLSGVRLQSPSRRVAVATGGGLFLLLALPWFLLHQPNLAEASAMARRPFVYVQLEMARTLSDFDRDGYSAFLGDGDCAAFDSQVSPGRVEIPNNGIDDNCLLGDGQSMEDLHEDLPIPSEPSPVNVLLITIDTLRPDRMSVFGYERDTTPVIEEWAKDATRYTAAYTSGGWTSLAVPSLMSGYYPRRLWWNPLVETSKFRTLRPPIEGKLRPGEKARAHYLLPIDDPRPPLAMLLQRRGMHTMAAVDGGFTQILAPEWGFGRGFDQYHEVIKQPRNKRGDSGTVALALRALKQRPEGKPFFLWVHFFGPHAPSHRHEEVPNFGDEEPDKYDNEIAWVDTQVGRLIEAVEVIEDRTTAVVLTSDHGERFYNARSRGHGRDAAEASIRVPLIVKGPGFSPGEVSSLVSVVDVVPTIMGFTATPAPARLDGTDLKKLGDLERTLFIDTFVRNKQGTDFRADVVVALSGDQKLVRDRVKGTLELNSRSDLGYPPKNLLPEVDAPQLFAAMDRYLEAAGGAPRVVE